MISPKRIMVDIAFLLCLIIIIGIAINSRFGLDYEHLPIAGYGRKLPAKYQIIDGLLLIGIAMWFILLRYVGKLGFVTEFLQKRVNIYLFMVITLLFGVWTLIAGVLGL